MGHASSKEMSLDELARYSSRQKQIPRDDYAVLKRACVKLNLADSTEGVYASLPDSESFLERRKREESKNRK
eukprot:3211500-Rhodomonas_salina.1